jgi:type III secretion protein Q
MTARMSTALDAVGQPRGGEPQSWRPLRDLPCYTSRQVRLHNRLHRRYAPWQSTLAGERLTVSWAQGLVDHAALAEGADAVAIGLTLGDDDIQLRIPPALLALSGQAQSVTGLRSESDAMLLELAWLEWIEPLETRLGAPLRLGITQDALARYPVVVPLEVRVGERPPFAITLQVDTATAERMAGWLEQYAAPLADPLASLHLTLAAEIGEAPLSLEELRSLVPGDVVMLDRLPDGQLRLRLGEQLYCPARRTGDTLECLAALTALISDRNDSMTDTLTPTDGARDLDTALDELPLRLVCQIGSVEVSLAQLREMGPGSLLQLTSATQDSVDLMVNGRRVGRGELVTIGDGLGVRLLGFCAP